MKSVIVVLCLIVLAFAANKKIVIHSDKAPPAIGAYSQAIQVADTIYLSGQIGLVGDSGKLISDDAPTQADQALKNIGYVLEAAGLNYTNVVQCDVLLTDITQFSLVDTVYARRFREEPPARAAYAVAALPKNAKVEIKCTAFAN